MTIAAVLALLRRFAVPLLIALCVISVLASVRSCKARRDAQDAAQAKVDAGLASARSDAGKDAVAAVSGAADREAAIDAIGRENANAIRTAPGASAPLDPAVAAAGRRSLCRRAVYRDSEQCKRLLQPHP